MTVSAYMPDVTVEIAFNSGYSTAIAARVWTDVSAYVELDAGIEITHGRGDEFSVCDPNRLSLTLDNSDGRFTAGRAASPYSPNVKIGRPIRVRSTRVGGVATDRFVGYIDEWPIEWLGVDSMAMARITASSRMARLGVSAELQSVIEEEYLVDMVTRGSLRPYYFPLGEPAESLSAADITKNGVGKLSKVQLGVGGAINFGANTGPNTDALPAPAFQPASVVSGAYLSGSIVADYSLGVEAFVLTSAAVQQTVIRLRDPGRKWVEINFTAAGRIQVTDYDVLSFGPTFTMTSPLAYNDGATHHVYVTMATAASVSARLYVDGVNVASVVGATVISLPTFTEMQVGGNNYGALFTGTISHVGIVPVLPTDPRILAHATAGRNGFTSDTATQRLNRVAGYALIPAAEVAGDAGTGLVGHIDTTGRTAIEIMRVIEQTESGVLYDARDGSLTLKARSGRYNVASAFTLSAASQQVEAGILPRLDRSALRNDVTGTATDGTTARVVNQASIDAYGYARDTLEVAGTTEAALQVASWEVSTYCEPMPRIPALGVDLLPLSAALQASLFSASVGTRFTVSGLPAQAQASSVDFFIEGYTESIGVESYAFAFNLSPVTGFDVWILEDAIYGQYDAYPLAL